MFNNEKISILIVLFLMTYLVSVTVSCSVTAESNLKSTEDNQNTTDTVENLDKDFSFLKSKKKENAIDEGAYNNSLSNLKKRIKQLRLNENLSSIDLLKLFGLKAEVGMLNKVVLKSLNVLKSCWRELGVYWHKKTPIVPDFLSQREADKHIDVLQKSVGFSVKEKVLIKEIFARRLFHIGMCNGLKTDEGIRKFKKYSIEKTLNGNPHPQDVHNKIEKVYEDIRNSVKKTVINSQHLRIRKNSLKRHYQNLVTDFGNYKKLADGYTFDEINYAIEFIILIMK